MAQSGFKIHGSYELLSSVLLFKQQHNRRLADKKCIQWGIIWGKENLLFAERPSEANFYISGPRFDSKSKHYRLNICKSERVLDNKETNSSLISGWWGRSEKASGPNWSYKILINEDWLVDLREKKRNA